MILLPHGPFRWLVALLGASSLVSSALERGLRYDRVINVLLACVLIAAGALPPEYRTSARKFVFGLSTLFFALAGVTAGKSIEEAIALIVGGVFAAIFTLLFGTSHSSPRHSARPDAHAQVRR
ncbi:MAG TPA: hypothetical protein VGL75_03300 [Acidothermaceae bacterium]